MSEVKYSKSADGYGKSGTVNNYVAEDELTVEITLAEYRDLVRDVALRDKDVKMAEEDKYERETENRNLKEENDALKAEMFELKKELDGLKDGITEAVDYTYDKAREHFLKEGTEDAGDQND
ncbi:MAG: hypothetical protein VB031_02395 [Eubacteriaceae bacterium]|nr:hypothetical protein [Eubacteriaceae bacterium]